MSAGVRVVCYKGIAKPTFVKASETKSTERLLDLSPEYVSSLSQDISSRVEFFCLLHHLFRSVGVISRAFRGLVLAAS